MPGNGRTLVIRQILAKEPIPAATVEQIGMRAFGNQMRVKDGVDLVLDAGAMADDLVAACHQTSHALGDGIWCPDLRQEAGSMQVRQNPCIDLVRLDPGMGDRLDLQWIGNDHPCHMRRQHMRDRHAVTRRLDHDPIG